MIIQESKCGSSTRTFINLPKIAKELLGWEKGDKVTFDIDKRKDSLTITRRAKVETEV